MLKFIPISEKVYEIRVKDNDRHLGYIRKYSVYWRLMLDQSMRREYVKETYEFMESLG